MLIVTDRARGMGSVGSVLSSVGKALGTAAQKTAAGAVQGAGQTIGQSLRNLISPGSAGKPGSAGAAAANYLPWIAGGIAVVGVGYLVLRRR